MSSLSLAVVIALANPVSAAEPATLASATAHVYRIDAVGLAEALREYSRVTGIRLHFDEALVADKSVDGLSGRYTDEQAIRELLAGTNLQLVQEGKAYRLVAADADAEELGEMRIVGDGAFPAYLSKQSSTATRMDLSPRETPQSLTVITREFMDDFATDRIADVLLRTPGVTVNAQDTERLQLSARGFGIDTYLYDGIPSMRSTSLTSQAALTDTAIYERIDVLRGASGLLHGIGNPSATINLVRKQPTRDFDGMAAVSLDSWGSYRVEADLSGPLSESGDVRGRLVGVNERGESYLDHYSNRREVLYGTLAVDLSPNSTLQIGFDHFDYDPEGSTWGPVPLYFSDGSEADLPRSFNPATDWSSWAQQASTAFARLEHYFANGWQARAAFTHRENSYDAQLASAGSGYPDPETGAGMSLWSGRYIEERDQNTIDVFVDGPLALFGREHKLMAGITYSESDRDYTGQPSIDFDATVPSVFDGVGDKPKPEFAEPNAVEETAVEQLGVFGAGQFKPTDDLAVILGGRLVFWERDVQGVNYYYAEPQFTDERYDEDGQLVPYAGLVYDITPQHAIYASYTSIFQPQTARDINNRILDPEEGNSYEAGIKSEYFGGRLSSTLAVFRIEQDNLAEATPDQIIGGPPDSVAYRAVDGAETEGAEVQLFGELLPGWNLLAGYTYRKTEDQAGEALKTTSPENLLRLSTTYDFGEQLDGLTVGGGFSWQSEISALVNRPGYDEVRYTQDSYVVVDLMASYRFDQHWSTRLNVSNLFDEKYYNNLGFYGGGYYGDERRVEVSLRFDF